MRINKLVAGQFLGCCLILASASTFANSQAMTAKPAVGTPQPPSKVYGKLLSNIEGEFVGAAEAMPDDKFNFAPPASAGEFKGVRSFSDQIKHVTDANYYFFNTTGASEADLKAKGEAIEKLKTKAEIIQALKDSLTQAHAFVDSITPENAFVYTATGTRGGMSALGIAHMMDHYGQMVVYLRMNGIVPPASRGGGM
jgi:uncharacterized damage-inducible protein DinB